VNPKFPLIFVHNRDENIERPTTGAFITEESILCAIDVEAKGTWMGLNVKKGTFTMLTNSWSESIFHQDDHPISRGILVNTLLNKGKDMKVFEE
jgi:uncharacterized protein with NRDE domain